MRTQRWQRAQFALEPELFVNAPLDGALTVIPLAQIQDHVFGGTTQTNLVSGQLIRNMEIGGIVFDVQFIVKPESDVTESPAWTAFAQCILYSDRLDEFSNPVALSTNWFTNTMPITLASAAADEDSDEKFPTRVHYRRAVALSGSFWQAPSDASNVLAQNPPAVRTQWSKSLRLRLRLDDQQALCVAFSLTGGADYPVIVSPDLVVKMMFCGSLYYRIRM